MTFTASGLLLVMFVLVIQGMSEGIRITRVSVPETLVVGDGSWINCEWEEEDDHVYTLKWYLGLHEFYRWTPAELVEEKAFPLESSFQIDLKESSRGRVRINNVTLEATGNYRCEVSGEAPYFKTSFDTDTLIVVDVPDNKPKITGLKETYRLRDIVDINCTSYNAKPKPELTFYLNNNLADSKWLLNYEDKVNRVTSLKTVTKGLRFQLLPSTISSSGKMLLKCTSAYPGVYWESTDKVINIDLPSYFPVTSDVIPLDYPVTGGGSSINHSRTLAAISTFLAVFIYAFLR